MIEGLSESYSQKVEMRHGIPFLIFGTVGFLSLIELRAIHRHLGYPSVEGQMKLLEKASIHDLDDNIRQELLKIVRYCKYCQLNKQKPRRCLFSVKVEATVEFNHILEIDVVNLSDVNFLLIVCSGTGFHEGEFLRNLTANDAWKTLSRCWINRHAGAPDYIHTDPVNNFYSKEFIDAAENLGIVLKVMPTESHEGIGKIEWAHAVFRAVYAKLKIDFPRI